MTGKPEVLALIPARGGSKGIPRKNMLAIAGKPLVAHSIAHALASTHITRTIVSTDDEEIAATARRFGAEVPFMRPSEFSRDDSTDFDVFRHALELLRETEGYVPELVVHLRPTGPVRRVAVIDEAIEKMLARPDAHSLRSVSQPVQTPYKMWQVNGDTLEPLLRLEGVTEAHSIARQALPEVWWQNGYVDIVRAGTVLDLGMMAGTRIIPFFTHDPILELDYPETIPAIEDALAKLESGIPLAIPDHITRHPM